MNSRIPGLFHAVKNGAPHEMQAFWNLCKTAAAHDAGGVAVGLSKIAFEVWADAYERGLHPEAPRATREAFAGSFGSASTVDAAVTKLAAEGRISDDEADYLHGLVAESAVRDLTELTKNAGFMDILKKPEVIGALMGGTVGAGVGAWTDDKNRARGALAGFVPGVIIGALGGTAVSHAQQEKAMKAVTQGVGSAKGRQAYDTLLEKGIGHDAFQNAVVSNKGRIETHFAQGNTHMPEFLEQHLQKPEDRTKMRNYVSKVFGSAKTSSLRQKLSDVMQGVEEGAPPPQSQPGGEPAPGALEGGQEGGPASTDPNAQGGEAIGQEPGIDDGSLDGHDKAMTTVDNMIFLAQQVQLPQLAQALDQGREQLAAHFSAGNAFIPPELQHHFAQSEHAETFMKKYKQRFGPIAGGAKKTASARPLDWSAWHLHH